MLNIEPNTKILTCDYCETQQAIKCQNGVMVPDIDKVYISTNKVASELAIVRIEKELENILWKILTARDSINAILQKELFATRQTKAESINRKIIYNLACAFACALSASIALIGIASLVTVIVNIVSNLVNIIPLLCLSWVISYFTKKPKISLILALGITEIKFVPIIFLSLIYIAPCYGLYRFYSVELSMLKLDNIPKLKAKENKIATNMVKLENSKVAVLTTNNLEYLSKKMQDKIVPLINERNMLLRALEDNKAVVNSPPSLKMAA